MDEKNSASLYSRVLWRETKRGLGGTARDYVVEKGISTGRSFAPPCLFPKPKNPETTARDYTRVCCGVNTKRGLRRTARDYTRVCCGGRQREAWEEQREIKLAFVVEGDKEMGVT